MVGNRPFAIWLCACFGPRLGARRSNGAQIPFRGLTNTRVRSWKALSPPANAGGALNPWLGGGSIENTGDYVNVDIALFGGVDVVANVGRLPSGSGA